MGFTNGFSKSTTKLENFVGTSYDETYDAYSSTYEIVAEYEKTSEYTPGTVISQDPVAGSKVLQGTKVKLTVAASEQDITVPNVYSYDEDRAKQALEMSGLKHTKTVSVSSENVDDGKVVYTEPKANTVVSADQEITIYISSGPSTTVIKTYKVPDVDGLTQSTAENFLKKTGFKNISFVTQDSPIAKGIVISQSPAAGATAKETDSIKVVISSGMTTTTTKKMLKTSVSIQLPRVIDKDGNYGSDTINVSVDGSTYLNQTVTLNGKTLSMKVSGKDNVVQSIQVSLIKTGATETKTTNGKNNQNFTIDFSGFSLDERNDTTDATKKNNQ